jgi:hypothetical protein
MRKIRCSEHTSALISSEYRGCNVLLFPLPILSPPNAPCSSIIRAWYNGPTGGPPSGLSLAPPTQQKKVNEDWYIDDDAKGRPTSLSLS